MTTKVFISYKVFNFIFVMKYMNQLIKIWSLILLWAYKHVKFGNQNYHINRLVTTIWFSPNTEFILKLTVMVVELKIMFDKSFRICCALTHSKQICTLLSTPCLHKEHKSVVVARVFHYVILAFFACNTAWLSHYEWNQPWHTLF